MPHVYLAPVSMNLLIYEASWYLINIMDKIVLRPNMGNIFVFQSMIRMKPDPPFNFVGYCFETDEV
jgi:hypothetical protein